MSLAGIGVGALEARLDELFALPQGTETPRDAGRVVNQLLEALESGAVRSAVRGDDGTWRAVPWVKRGILVAFRFGKLADLSPGGDASAIARKCARIPRCGGLLYIGETCNRCVAPVPPIAFDVSMATRVSFPPAPAITGTRPAARSAQSRTTPRRSSSVMVAASPVEPTGTSP